MTGLDNIINKIKEDADSVQLQIKEQAEIEAAKIMEAAQLEVEEKRKAMLNRAQDDGRLRQERMVSMAKLEGSKSVLKAKRDLIDQVYEKVYELLRIMPDQEYEDLLVRIITGTNPKASGFIRLSKDDKNRVSDRFISKVNDAFKQKGNDVSFELDPVNADGRGGFVLICGNIEINGTFEKMMEMRKAEFEPVISNTLFSD